MDRTLNLSSLHKLLHDTLLITEAVKEVLRRDCEEAAFALKSWPVKIVEKREDECTCKKVRCYLHIYIFSLDIFKFIQNLKLFYMLVQIATNTFVLPLIRSPLKVKSRRSLRE